MCRILEQDVGSCFGALCALGKLPDDLVLRVQLENPRHALLQLAVSFQQALEIDIHVALVRDQAHGAVCQSLGCTHVLNGTTEFDLDRRDQFSKVWSVFIILFFVSFLTCIELIEVRCPAPRLLEAYVWPASTG